MHASTITGGHLTPGPAGPASTAAWTESIRRLGAISAAYAIVAIMVVAYVALSLGLGYETYSGAGPDRPPLPGAPAPAPPPVQPLLTS